MIEGVGLYDVWDLNQGFKAKVQFKDGENVVVVTFP